MGEGNHIYEDVDTVGLVHDAFAMVDQSYRLDHSQPFNGRGTQDGVHAMGDIKVKITMMSNEWHIMGVALMTKNMQWKKCKMWNRPMNNRTLKKVMWCLMVET